MSGCIWPFRSDIDVKAPWGRAPLSYTSTHAQRRGYLFLPWMFSLYDAIHEWMMGRTNGWMDGSRDEKNFTKNDHDLLYYM
jgi:hypothetical protein